MHAPACLINQSNSNSNSNSPMSRGPPPGIKLFRGKEWSLQTYRYLVLLVTFIAYVCYHASRKPTGIVKSVLCPDAIKKAKYSGWAPFNGPNGVSKLGEIDVAFLACYSLGMYVAGHLGDSLDLRLFLTMGMIGSGIFVGLFGMGYFMNVHEFWFYLLMQMIAGLFQATGWPSVVAVIGNWFGKRKRGLIMGIWNAHTSVGNISGSLLAASVLDYGWGWSFVLLGLLIMFGGFVVFLFLPAYPEDVGFCYIHGDEEEQRVKTVGGDVVEGEGERQRENQRSGDGSDGKDGRGRSIGLYEACMIPGVITFAMCLFFAKLVAYTFLYWLPFYLTQTGNQSSITYTAFYILLHIHFSIVWSTVFLVSCY